MNEKFDEMTIRLVGYALALLLMAGVTIYTGLFTKATSKVADVHAAVISTQESHVAVEDVLWN